MQAAVYDRPGPARDVLRVVELPDPVPGPGEVRVRLHQSGVNPTDWRSRTAAGPVPLGLQTPGQDGAGMIEAVGLGGDPARIGERVWVYHAAYRRPGGTAAQYTCVPSDQAVRLPDGVGFTQGAGLGIPFITAHRCVFANGSVRGQRLLVTGGAGAVGNAAIQLARWGGGHVVATVSSPEKAELALAAGAKAVVDYTARDAAEQLRSAAAKGVRRIVDVALGANLESDLAVLSPHGTICTYATEAADPVLPVRTLMTANVALQFVLVYTLTPAQLHRATTQITRALEAGALHPLPEHHFPLADIAAAHEAVENHVVGKVILDIP
jgi:NADPH:quinone reductase-like Zn-dependent oxidoreductase